MIRAVHALGMSDAIAQRLWLSLLYASAAAAVAYLALSLGLLPFGAGIAGAIAVLNFYFLQVFPHPWLLVALATAGLSGGLILRALRGGPPAGLVGVALSTIGLGYVFINPPALAVVLAWLLFIAIAGWRFGGPGAGRRLLRLTVTALPLIALVNAWWAVPALLTIKNAGAGAATFTAVTDVQSWSWTHARASLGNLMALGGAWGWKEPSYFPYSQRLDSFPFFAFRYVLPATALLAPFVAGEDRRRVAIWFFAAALVSIWIAKGLHRPLPGVNLFLYKHVAGFWLLREPMTKALFVTVICYAVLTGITFQRLLSSLRWYRVGSVVILVGLMLAAVYPLLNGEVIPDKRPVLPSAHVRIPAYWDDIARFLNEAPSEGKVLVLPLADYYQMPTTWGYYGADLTASLLINRPVLSSLPGGYFAPPSSVDDLLHFIENSSLARGFNDIRSALALLGARYVIVRHDFERPLPGRALGDPQIIGNALGRTPGLHLMRTFGALDLYQVDDSGEVRVATNTFRYRGPAQSLSGVAARLPPGDAIVDSGSAGPEALAVRVAAPAGSGPGVISINVKRGRYRALPYGASTMRRLFVKRDTTGGLTATMADAVTFGFGPNAVHLSPPLTARIKDVSEQALIRIGDQELSVPARSTYDAGLIPMPGPPPIQILEPNAAKRPVSIPALPNTLSDCNRSDDRTMEEVGLGAQVVQDAGPTLRLRARDHSACVSVPIEPF
ncbi:MAG: DUF3367 domain-containing protein, partial [Actinobacteria bacterium]|nr:DUF3367 domain-containing protein [Actinomycetota bacterium]